MAGLGLAAVVLLRFGLLLLVFLIPIQIVWVRRGERAGLLSSGVFLGALALFEIVNYLRIRSMLDGAGSGMGLVFLDIVLPVAFLAGLYLLNTPHLSLRVAHGGRELNVVERIGAALLTAAIIYASTIVLVYLSGSADGIVATLVELVRPLLTVVGATEDEILALVQKSIQVFLSGFLLGFFMILIGNWWLGTRLALRNRVALPGPNEVAERLRSFSITRFSLPVGMIWVVIAAWSGVLLSMLVDVGWLSFVIWNAALLTLAMYSIQGLAVIWHLLDRRKVARNQRLVLAVVLILGLNVVFLVGLSALGISEVWVNYHRFERNGEEQ